MQIRISAIILTKNEERNIEECLKSLSWCEEILVIDDYSSDKTIEMAKKMGAVVFSHPLSNDFSAQRNFGLSKAKGDWVLFVDADERVSPALWYEIMQRTTEPENNYSGFFIKRTDTIWGKELKYGEIGNIKLLRLARKKVGLWEGKVHETWKIKGKTLILSNPLQHFPHKNVREFLKEINYYSDLRAKDLFEKKVKTSWFSVIFYPKAKFILNFILRRGFLDGFPGLIFAIIMSFHSFLVRGKLWVMWNKNKF